MTKIIGYARGDTTKQDLSRQKLKIKEFCENNNYELIEIIEDFGISGVVSDRRGYLELQSRTYKDDVMKTVPDFPRMISKGISVKLLHSPRQIFNAGLLVDLTESLILIIKAWAAAHER
jgi:Site-specific recombinases, DNA invertase Pin homologs